MISYLMLFASVTMTVVASTLLKIGSRTVNFDGGLFSIAMGYMTSPVIVLGFASYALAAILWVYCLSVFDLSHVTFVSSFQYVLLMAVSIFVFHEQISLMKWAGCIFIIIGVFLWLKG
ncbi:EamA family transporter [Sporolituus thermophilus]|uniref:EamA-like transporter family n=1 Tax=Sporolituus thermophilus DSM 23256 TaxID=1123285 RepID=A0A1G7JY74_9FIRM|nr:EamA family transporter [Sporolituus thermophilus]SDF29765.1 EamA-like transporter family [Sporolituus thermophilus DSM 23256]